MKRHFGVNPGKLYLTSDPVWTENISGKMISASLLANLGYVMFKGRAVDSPYNVPFRDTSRTDVIVCARMMVTQKRGMTTEQYGRCAAQWPIGYPYGS